LLSSSFVLLILLPLPHSQLHWHHHRICDQIPLQKKAWGQVFSGPVAGFGGRLGGADAEQDFYGEVGHREITFCPRRTICLLRFELWRMSVPLQRRYVGNDGILVMQVQRFFAIGRCFGGGEVVFCTMRINWFGNLTLLNLSISILHIRVSEFERKI